MRTWWWRQITNFSSKSDQRNVSWEYHMTNNRCQTIKSHITRTSDWKQQIVPNLIGDAGVKVRAADAGMILPTTDAEGKLHFFTTGCRPRNIWKAFQSTHTWCWSQIPSESDANCKHWKQWSQQIGDAGVKLQVVTSEWNHMQLIESNSGILMEMSNYKENLSFCSKSQNESYHESVKKEEETKKKQLLFVENYFFEYVSFRWATKS